MLGERWGLEFGALIPRGSMSVIIRCDTADGRSAVLKIAPDRQRLGRAPEARYLWPIAPRDEYLEWTLIRLVSAIADSGSG